MQIQELKIAIKINIEGYVNGGVYLFNNKLLKYIKKLKI